MHSLVWVLVNRTAETEFIFNLFHLLLTGLTLLVVLQQLRPIRREGTATQGSLLPLGFILLGLHFALLTLYFGAGFFFHRELGWDGFERFSYGLMACGLLLVAGSKVAGRSYMRPHLTRWIISGCAVVTGLALVDVALASPKFVLNTRSHSLSILATDAVVLLAVGLGLSAIRQAKERGQLASVVALATVGLFLLLHSASLYLPRAAAVFFWEAEQHVLSVSLFAFAWAAGESSGKLLYRIFVRLNLTFLVLASLIMLITVGMEKYQYLRLAEERSLNLAEFLRGHIAYYRERGGTLEQIFRQREVLKRVVVEFGTLPELREVNVYLDGQRASFRHAPNWEIEEEITTLAGKQSPAPDPGLANSFQMIRLPLGNDPNSRSRIEFLGTMDYVNEYIGKYIVVIYLLFTVMVGLASAVVGIIVHDADRQLRQQYAELQETHQQLAQAAKLASIGQLAGGVAHEINTPVTSILALASHLAEGKRSSALAPGHRNSLRLIAEQADRVSRIVGNLLVFSRQSHLELGRVDIGELLETAITLIQYRLKDGRIGLRRSIHGDLPVVLGDAGRLVEVFVNLLNNAIDAMSAQGALIVRAYRAAEPDGGVRVEVADTGCGIPPEKLPRIFDPFFTTKEPGRGTGLGLSISHGIVKDHGGRIWAESKVGEGTTVVVILPKGGELR